MNCDTCQSKLIDFEYDELPAPERSEVAQHLATCPDCAVESCRLRADLEGIVAAVAQAPSPSVRDELRNRVEAAVQPSLWGRFVEALRRPIPAYAAAAVAVVPVAIWGALSMNSRVERRPPPAPPATITDYDGIATRMNAPGVL